jgi:menaquinone-specific isochorismate synthase
MSSYIETSDIIGLKYSIGILKHKITEFCSNATADCPISRISQDVSPEAHLIDWLRAAKSNSKIYWSDRNGNFEMAGLGDVYLITTDIYKDVKNIVDRASRFIKNNASGVRIYGGISFPANQITGSSQDWKPFGAARFVIPRLELIRQAEKTTLVCNLTPHDIGKSELAIRQIDDFFTGECESTKLNGHFVSRTDLPDFGGWERVVNSVIRDFGSRRIEKIVLARQTSIQFEEECNGLELLRKLSTATSKCYHYYFQPQRGTSFLGASPELLYSRRGNEIQSEALAGTKPRGKSEIADREFEYELLKSEKELREHKYVVDNIKSALKSLCDGFEAREFPEILKLAQVQHLRTEFKGRLRQGAADAEIIIELHPTAAVGGFPSSEAQSLISDYEKFDRGWYSGAVGWLGKDEAEMVVAIRSGLIKDNVLKLHSGAGLIKGSTAKSEWDEIESKIAGFLNVVSG